MDFEVSCDENAIKEYIFKKNYANALIGYDDNKPIGYAVYFFNFSTFTGHPGLYLEDIFIDVSCRGKGYGKLFFKELAKIAYDNKCCRMEWSCLNWNEPSILFYKKMGAKQMNEWTTYRLSYVDIEKLLK